MTPQQQPPPETAADVARRVIELSAKASPGPWGVHEECGDHGARTVTNPDGRDIFDLGNNGCASDPQPDYVIFKKEDAELIAYYRNSFPQLAHAYLQAAEALSGGKLWSTIRRSLARQSHNIEADTTERAEAIMDEMARRIEDDIRAALSGGQPCQSTK